MRLDSKLQLANLRLAQLREELGADGFSYRGLVG